MTECGIYPSGRTEALSAQIRKTTAGILSNMDVSLCIGVRLRSTPLQEDDEEGFDGCEIRHAN